MKNLFSLLILVFSVNTFAQGTTCAGADPFCSGTTYDFPNNTGVAQINGPNYGCLSDAKNPAWYFMKIAETGPMKLTIKQTTQPNGQGSGLDVDFAIWGPFTTADGGCTSIMNGTLKPIQSSYSTSATETIGLGVQGGSNSICATFPPNGATTPPAAVQGEFYMVMVTNYSNQNGYITLNQTNSSTTGAGVTDCSILSCDVNGITATPTCNSDNTVTVSGAVTVATNITTGTLIVSSSCGDTVLFYPPFPATATPLNFSFNAGASNGQQCTIKATFSDNLTCEKSTTITKQLIPAMPTFFPTPATCSTEGTNKVINYDASFTYTVTPSGPTVGAGGVISGATAGTTYSVTSKKDGCESPVGTFTNEPKSALPDGPIIDPQSFCDSAKVSNLMGTGINIKWYADQASTTPMNGNEPVTTGTYYATQTINGCESPKVPVNVIIHQPPTVDAGADRTICKERQTNLKASGASTYIWTPATNLNTPNGASVIASPQTTTTYIVKGTDVNGCVGYDSVKVTVVNAPTANFSFTPDTGIPPLEVTFTNASSAATSFFWDLGNGKTTTEVSNITTTYDTPNEYTVMLVASNGHCKDTATAKVIILRYPDPTIYIPNVFTPNGDGANDVFFVTTTNIKEMRMEIFNRWGNVMTTLNTPIETWDGGQASDGVYFYKYRMVDFNDEEHTGQGFFHLVDHK